MKVHMFLKTEKLKENQQGFASIVVALTLIIILSLITVGFAQFIRREQNNALNKQLSTQAFYAAESGVNDVIKNIGTFNFSTANTDCKAYFASNGGPSDIDGSVDLAHGVSYTCVLVDVSPGNLFHSKVGDPTVENSNSNSWNVNATASQALSAGLDVSWVSNGGTHSNAPGSVGSFLPRSIWTDATHDYMGVLRLSITDLNAGLSRSNLIAKTSTYYLYPTTGGAANPSFGSGNGSVYAANCSSGSCKVRINNLTGTKYLFHIESIYDSSDITLAPADAGIGFVGTQAVIDVTGKAQDVLRRIQVRYPLQPNLALPTDTLEVRDICKRMALSPNAGQNEQYGISTSLSPVSNAPTNSSRCNVEYIP